MRSALFNKGACSLVHTITVTLVVLLGMGACGAQTVDDLSNVAVQTFNEQIYTSGRVDSAAYVSPGYCKRAWFKYPGQPYNWFPLLSGIPPLLNADGALLEDSVQVADL